MVGRSVATIRRVLAGLGLSSLKALKPQAPVVRYEHNTPGEWLHMDIKKLGRATTHGARAGSFPMWPLMTTRG